jgi:hypothetical protein
MKFSTEAKFPLLEINICRRLIFIMNDLIDCNAMERLLGNNVHSEK